MSRFGLDALRLDGLENQLSDAKDFYSYRRGTAHLPERVLKDATECHLLELEPAVT
jgi:hypothetical protein